jgi:hypothetical protein
MCWKWTDYAVGKCFVTISGLEKHTSLLQIPYITKQ